jgi:hypothetical protein
MSLRDFGWWVAPGLASLIVVPFLGLNGWDDGVLFFLCSVAPAICALVALLRLPRRARSRKTLWPLALSIGLAAAVEVLEVGVLPGCAPLPVRWKAHPVIVAIETWKANHGAYPRSLGNGSAGGHGFPPELEPALATTKDPGFTYLCPFPDPNGSSYLMSWSAWRDYAYRSDTRQWCDLSWGPVESGRHSPVLSRCDAPARL